MAGELDAIEMNNTWSVIKLPDGKHSIGCRWIYKIKKSNGSIDRYKASLVARDILSKRNWISLRPSHLLPNLLQLRFF